MSPAATSPKPGVVMVPGAWHVPAHFQRLADELAKAGFDARVVSKPSTETSRAPGTATFDDDVQATRAQVAAFLPRAVILLAHSYGGMIATQATEGLAASTRQKNGQAGGITHLIYMAAGMPLAGQSLIDVSQPPPPVMPSKPDGNGQLLWIADPAAALWHDVDATERARLAALLVPQSAQPFRAAVTYEAWRDVPTTYIRCSEDRAMLTQWQDQMIAAVRGAGGSVDVRSYTASHSPFASMPGEMVAVIEELAAK